MDAKAVVALLRPRVVITTRDRWTRDELFSRTRPLIAPG